MVKLIWQHQRIQAFFESGIEIDDARQKRIVEKH